MKENLKHSPGADPETLILEVGCSCEDCGMVSAYEFWRDGSFKRVLDACHHAKDLPNREKVREAFDAAERVDVEARAA